MAVIEERQMKRWLLLIFLSCAGGAWAQLAPVGADPVVDEIRIRSTWGGLSPDSPLITELVVRRSDGGFTMTGTSSRAGKLTAMPPMRASTGDVAALVAAMEAPSRAKFDAGDLGRPDRDVQARIDGEMESESGEDFPIDPAIAGRMQAYRETLRHPGDLATALTAGFRSFHTDDYPGVWVEIALSDGSKIVASSRSQQYLMLPWNRDGQPPTYSPAISQALWRLLPKGATNRDRLHGPISDFELDELVTAGLFDVLNRFDAEAKAGDALRVLEASFVVEEARAQKRLSWMQLGPVLFASLRLPDGPKNLHMKVRLPLKGSALENSDADLARLQAALSLVQRTPALAARIRDQPGEDFRIYDGFGYAWLNERTAEQFIAQMRQLGRIEQLGDNPGLMRGAVMVEEGDAPAYWIALADGRAVLWKKFTNAAATPTTVRCSSIPMGDDIDELLESRKNHLCIGRIYPP